MKLENHLCKGSHIDFNSHLVKILFFPHDIVSANSTHTTQNFFCEQPPPGRTHQVVSYSNLQLFQLLLIAQQLLQVLKGFVKQQTEAAAGQDARRRKHKFGTRSFFVLA